MHDDPARPWTVAALAAEVGVSRPGPTRGFTRHVGEPPMTRPATWRVALAADLLRDTDATLSSIAHRVGYSTTFAFKRRRGITPTQHRAVAARARG